nr:IMP cyclohydrolase [Deltaproteobacteria bacterium]
MKNIKIQRALVSVSDKTGVLELGQSLQDRGVEILSTGGTAQSLRNAGISVVDVSAYTGFPEIMDGRVKTLHPKVHGALLGIREKDSHVRQMSEHGIKPIDLVVVNLYPFENTVARQDCTLEDAIENIDIGGPTMLRSAAKNYTYVAVVTDPKDYQKIIKEMDSLDNALSLETRFYLAKKVFQLTAHYDTAITEYLKKV